MLFVNVGFSNFRSDELTSAKSSVSNIVSYTNDSEDMSHNPPYHKQPTELRHTSTDSQFVNNHLCNVDIERVKSHSNSELRKQSEPHLKKSEPHLKKSETVTKNSSTQPGLTDESNFRMSSSPRKMINNSSHVLAQTHQATERKRDTKAARMLSAILLAFICTWSPYMAFTLINAFRENTISSQLYSVGEFLVLHLPSTDNFQQVFCTSFDQGYKLSRAVYVTNH